MANLKSYAKIYFIFSLTVVGLGGSFLYGVFSHRHNLQPIPLMRSAANMVKEVIAPSDRILEADVTTDLEVVQMPLPARVQPGLILIAGIAEGRDTSVRVMDREGEVIHEWMIRWSDVWPSNEGNFPSGRRPEEGMYLHGLDILPEGDIVANFEHLSTFRVNVCGGIEWKLDNLGHHAVHLSYDNTLWVAAENYVSEGPTGIPFHDAPLRDWTVQQLTVDGEVLREISMFDVLIENDLMGLLYMSSLKNGAPYSVSGDTLHLNDIDVFPDTLQSSIFNPGDIMLSLRNINTVLVVDPDTLELKFLSVGRVMRQHDPDFMSGDRISIFDNRNFTAASEFNAPSSRIVEVDAKTGDVSVVLDKSSTHTFFTNIMGTHQRLSNGNIFINESGAGRALEMTPEGELAYSYQNITSEGVAGRTFLAMLLPSFMDRDFFNSALERCAND